MFQHHHQTKGFAIQDCYQLYYGSNRRVFAIPADPEKGVPVDNARDINVLLLKISQGLGFNSNRIISA